MSKYTNLTNEINKHINSFNIILADKDAGTFKKLQKLNSKFNFINLSSYFAVSFILEYEKIDLIIISKKISNLIDIKKKADKKKIKVCVLGMDIGLPINEDEIKKIILKEIEKKFGIKKNRWAYIKKCIGNFLSPDIKKKRILKIKVNKIKTKKKRFLEVKNKNKSKHNKEEDSAIKKRRDLPIMERNSDYKDNVIFPKRYSDLEIEKKPIKTYGIKDFTEKKNLRIKTIKTIKQKVIILSKAKGGVGSTTISIFLSFIFKKISTLLVDLNFSEGGGDISYYLSIPKAPNILNFIDGYSRESLKNSVIQIRENLDVLQTPPTYKMSRKLDLQDIYCLADIAKKKYHLIIFDLPNKFDDLFLGVIDLADLLIMVSDYSLGSIGRLIKINNRFINDDLEKILIINKYIRKNGLGLFRNQIEEFFHLKDFIFLDESEVLRGKTEFLNFNFKALKSFGNLTEKIFSLLSCD